MLGLFSVVGEDGLFAAGAACLSLEVVPLVAWFGVDGLPVVVVAGVGVSEIVAWGTGVAGFA